MECEGQLAEALPALNEALAALDTIKEADIAYIKKLGSPPAAIKLVLEVNSPPPSFQTRRFRARRE
jgi:dynein heavy chain